MAKFYTLSSVYNCPIDKYSQVFRNLFFNKFFVLACGLRYDCVKLVKDSLVILKLIALLCFKC